VCRNFAMAQQSSSIGSGNEHDHVLMSSATNESMNLLTRIATAVIG
jgi:hypothetical protein